MSMARVLLVAKFHPSTMNLDRLMRSLAKMAVALTVGPNAVSQC